MNPKTLYKYVSADRAMDCISYVGNGTLRATQPSALNDPFECASTNAVVYDTMDADKEFADIPSHRSNYPLL